jgi:predicted TIM-barrel fold metal-dependent hydrolase
MISRRSLFLTALAAKAETRLLIDTHLEVWTDDPRFPFAHPERPDLKQVPVQAPIENQVEQMKDFGLKYAVLITPRYYGWDASYTSYSLHKYPKLFVAHGLINPLDPKVHERLRYWVKAHRFQGMRFSPIYHPQSTWLNSKEHYPLWREAEKLGAVFNYYILPHQMPMLEEMCGRFPGVKVFRLKKFPQVWISNSEPYEMSELKKYPYEDTWPFYKAIYEEFGGRQIIWGTGYPRPRWELPMDQELEFVDKHCSFYSAADRRLMLGENALRIWRFPK